MSDEWVRDYDRYLDQQEERNLRTTWEVVRYHDVWGNKEEGWEINGATRIHRHYEMPWDHNDDDVLEAFGLKELHEAIEVDDQGEIIELKLLANGCPLGCMTKNDD